MRYIGNKTRLIPFLLGSVEELVGRPGVACDPFAGTASVARALKARGWRVHCGDVMALSYAFQVARVEMDRTPRFAITFPDPDVGGRAGRSATGSASYGAVLDHLEALPARPGFITQHFTPGGQAGRRHGRMYFTAENGARIDHVRDQIERWGAAGLLSRVEEQLLLATLIQAADRVANTTGVYASFVKSWQPNAVKPLRLRGIRPTAPVGRAPGGCTAFRGRATDLVDRVGSVDLLYLDPPYNERQYPGYYHIPELLATGWSPPPTLRGKTGLIPDEDRRSDWCRKGRCEAALRTLLERTDAGHVLLSYNDEGLLPAERIEAVFRETGDPDTYRHFDRRYKRYRSDADGPQRTYRRDRVRECLHYVRRP